MSTITLLCIALAGVIMLLLLVIKAKVQPFVALLLVSLLVALAAGIPAGEVGKVMIAGMGGVLGSVTIIIGLGAMLGRMIEHSGGAESLANYFSRKLGDKRTIAALTLAAFFLGIPVFFDVGFIILAPIIYGFAKVAKISPLKFGLPVAGIMLTVHVAVPPHPGPVAAAGLLHADIGWLTIIGIAISIPVGIVGYFAAKIINKRQYAMSVEVLEQMQLAPASEEGATKLSDKINPPGVALVTSLIVIPIAIIMAGTVSATLMPPSHPLLGTLQLIGSPMVALMIALVLAFQSSTNLASAYGVSVSGTMLIDTLLLALLARAQWARARWWVLPCCFFIILVDIGFLIANGAKFFHGAWFPIALGLLVFTMMRTWRRGRELLREEVRKDGIQLDVFLPGLMLAPPVRVPGTAVFLTADSGVVPHALLHNLKHNKVLHEHNAFLTVETLNVPYAPKDRRMKIDSISGDDFYRVIIRYGFMETPDVPVALMRSCDQGELTFNPMDTTYFVSRESIVAGRHRGMPIWRDKLFAFLHRNAAPATNFFRIPGNRLVELGAQVEI